MTIASALVSLVLLLQVGTTPPKFSARLLAAHESVPPGGQTDLLVEIQVDKPWHIYDPIVLDTGLPTTVKFATPPGVSIGELRFPAPKLGKTAGFEYLEHSGTIRAMAPLTLAPDVKPGQTLAISAEVSGLACIEMCVPVQATAKLELLVTVGQGKPANEKLFKEARDKLAPLLADAPHIKGSTLRVSKDKLGINEPAELLATIRVQKAHHIQDRDPGVDTLIASRLLIEKIPGVEFAEEEKQIWPPPRVRDIPYVGKVREQSGDVTIRVPFKITDAKFPSGPVTVRVLFQYQACTEAGQCFPPEIAAGFVRFVADTPTAPMVQAAGSEPEPTEPTGASETAPPTDNGRTAALAEGDTSTGSASTVGQISLLYALVAGFLGGLILNVMPCVLPVISIKIISFVQQAGEDPKRIFRVGLVFCAGIMVWFWLFAALSARANFPLQSPTVVLAIATIVFVFALNLFGVFEIVLPGAAASKLGRAATREGYPGSFFKGFLATLLGTACTAPFLVSALAYASTQPALVGFLVFSSAGLGMASPYLLLSAHPAWLRYVPRPGAWMLTFKQAMGFVLLGTAIWLLSILKGLVDADGVLWTLCFWGFLAVAVWLLGKIKPTWESPSRFATWGAAVGIVLVGWWFSFSYMYDWHEASDPARSAAAALKQPLTPAEIVEGVAKSSWSARIPWQAWRPGLAEDLASRGLTVYVDYTADWCLTCRSNKKLVLETETVRAKMHELGVIPIKADFTKKNPTMAREIESHGSPTVPLNLVYPAGAPERVIKLPVLLTQETVRGALEQAGPSNKDPDLRSPTGRGLAEVAARDGRG